MDPTASQSRPRRSRPRRGFTLIELMTVAAVLILLIGLLIPVVSRARRSAQITTMKLNFQAIAAALENYKSDFRDYPRNNLPVSMNDAQGFARTEASLVMALVGPGPASALNGYTNGDVDGFDGPGFRTTLAPVGTLPLSGSASAGASSFTVTGTLPSNFSVVTLGGPGSPDAHVLVKSVSGSTVNLAAALQNAYTTGTTVGFLTPVGRPTAAYLPPDKFKITYTQTANDALPLPVFLDIWGGPILYFPTYKNNTAGMLAGPLLGSPANAASNTPNGTAVFWDGPTQAVPARVPATPTAVIAFTAGQRLALLFKLGDQDGSNGINGSEAFAVQRPFFLASPGPDGVFFDLGTTAASDRPRLMAGIDDVYSFDQ